jgi:hypothetical protein
MSTAWLRPPLEQRPRAFIFTGNLVTFPLKIVLNYFIYLAKNKNKEDF